MGIRIQIGVTAIASALLFAGLTSPAFAATKAGDSCKKTGQIQSVKKGKGELVCLKVAGSKTWVFVPLASTKANAIKTINTWRGPSTDLAPPNVQVISFFAISSGPYVADRLTLAQQGRDQLANQASALRTQQAALQAETTSLPSQVAQALSISEQAKAALDEPKKAYTSAASEAAILDSQYTSAYNNYVSYVSCKTLEMFGYGGPCGYFDSAGYSSIKYRYEAAQARADALWAAYTAKYNDYKAKYDEYRRLYDRQSTVQADLNGVTAELAQTTGALGAAEAHLRASHETNGQLQQLRASLARWDASTNRLQQLATKKVSSNWAKEYGRMARLSGIAKLHRNDVVAAFSNFRALTPDLPDPDLNPAPSEVGDGQAGSSDAPDSAQEVVDG